MFFSDCSTNFYKVFIQNTNGHFISTRNFECSGNRLKKSFMKLEEGGNQISVALLRQRESRQSTQEKIPMIVLNL